MCYKASIIGILMMLALKNINYKASIIGILMMLALKKINYKASIRTIRKCSKMDGQKYIPNTKGQFISKCPFDFIVWTKLPTKLFLNFCLEFFCFFLGASWKLFGASCMLPCL